MGVFIMNVILQLLRVHQWVKNAFVIFPLVFSGLFVDMNRLTAVLLTLWAYCCVASSVYIFNDLLDYQRDRLHPKKKNRPLSTGAVTPFMALCLAVPLLGIGIACGFWVNQGVGDLLLAYIVLHVVYNFWAKNIVILDVFFIAFGFQLRIWAGAMAAGVVLSVWLQLCVFVLALFLGFTKRRCEITALKDKAAEHRQALMEYNVYLLDQIIGILASLTVVFYGLYTISQEAPGHAEHSRITYSLAFVIFGIFRYLYLVHVKKSGDEPGELLSSDWPLLINVLLWLGYIVCVFYFV